MTSSRTSLQNEDEAKAVSFALLILLSSLAAYKANSFVDWLKTVPITLATVYPLSRAFAAINIRMRSSRKFRIHHITGIIQLSYAWVVWYRLVWDPSFLFSDDRQEDWFSYLFCRLARLCTVINLVSSIPLLAYIPRNMGAQLRRAFVYGILLMSGSIFLQYSFQTAQLLITVDTLNSPVGLFYHLVNSLHVVTCFLGISVSLIGTCLAFFSLQTVYQEPPETKKNQKISRRKIWQTLIESFVETDNENEADPSNTVVTLLSVGIPGFIMCIMLCNLLLNPGCINVDHAAELLRFNDVAMDLMNAAVLPCMMFDVTRLALGGLSPHRLFLESILAFLGSIIGPCLTLGALPELSQAYSQMILNISTIA